MTEPITGSCLCRSKTGQGKGKYRASTENCRCCAECCIWQRSRGKLNKFPRSECCTASGTENLCSRPKEEAKYLAVAREPLASLAAVLADTGMRPEECYRLRWEYVTWVNERFGSLLVTHGKDGCCTSRAAYDSQSQEGVRGALGGCCKLLEGWVWPARRPRAAT